MTILLLILIGFFKSIMDTIAFHYEVSIFYKLFNSKFRNWFYIPDSSNNKYNWFPNSKLLTWIFSGPLVFTTDAWHFTQMCLLFCISLLISINTNIGIPIDIPFNIIFIKIAIIHLIVISTFEIFWRLFKII